MQYSDRHYGPLSANIRQEKPCFRADLLSREEAGWHSVRGHFKIRKTGVYWWSPFYRVDPTKVEG